MPDKLQEMYDAWKAEHEGANEYQAFQGGATSAAVSMRARAQELAQKLTGNDLINAIGSLPDF